MKLAVISAIFCQGMPGIWRADYTVKTWIAMGMKGTNMKTADGDYGEVAPRPGGKYESLRPQRILVIDDEADILLLYSEVLVHSGYRVDTAQDGHEGWKALVASGGYDLLITDNNMPNLTGLELVRKVRSSGMNLPVILASGTAPLNREWLQLASILPKPFSLEASGVELIQKLRSARATAPVSSIFGTESPDLEWLEVAAILPKPFSANQLVQTVAEVLQTVSQTGFQNRPDDGMALSG